MPASSAWKEADRSDRLRYSQPARLRGETVEPSISGAASGASPVAAGEPEGTHYALLGVQRGASQAQLRRAYLRQLVTAHPDKGGQPERFQQLQAAFAVLSDPAERRIYDEKLERVHGGSNSSSAATASADSSCSCSRGGGVTAVVHGQTQGGGQQPPGPDEQPAGACPAARSGSALEEASADIRALQQAAGASSGSSCSSGGPAASGRLAEACLRRAGLRREAGQLHHALFDAEEALRLQPDLGKAAELVAALQAALQLPQAAAAQGEDQHHPGEDQLDDEPF